MERHQEAHCQAKRHLSTLPKTEKILERPGRQQREGERSNTPVTQGGQWVLLVKFRSKLTQY
jgi:hypothetical protein